MKKVLFWILFVPVGFWIVGWALIAGVFESIERWNDRWTRRFEAWCMDYPDEKVALYRIYPDGTVEKH